MGNNRYVFKFESSADDDFLSSTFPNHTSITAEHEIDSCATWEVALWQFCKFLETTGFEGVRNRVIVKTCFEDDNTTLFEKIYEPPEWMTQTNQEAQCNMFEEDE